MRLAMAATGRERDWLALSEVDRRLERLPPCRPGPESVTGVSLERCRLPIPETVSHRTPAPGFAQVPAPAPRTAYWEADKRHLLQHLADRILADQQTNTADPKTVPRAPAFGWSNAGHRAARRFEAFSAALGLSSAGDFRVLSFMVISNGGVTKTLSTGR